MDKFITNSFQETQKCGAEFARQILRRKASQQAVVLALSGDLGAGKTTFLQGFARGLGIEEVVNSPTFIIMKRFKINDLRFKNFYHIDLYRLENSKDLEFFNFREIIANPENIVAIEWPEKIGNIVPKRAIWVKFGHLQKNRRELLIRPR